MQWLTSAINPICLHFPNSPVGHNTILLISVSCFHFPFCTSTFQILLRFTFCASISLFCRSVRCLLCHFHIVERTAILFLGFLHAHVTRQGLTWSFLANHALSVGSCGKHFHRIWPACITKSIVMQALCASLLCNDPLFVPFWCFKQSLYPPSFWRNDFSTC